MKVRWEVLRWAPVVIALAAFVVVPVRGASNKINATTHSIESFDFTIPASDGCTGEDVHVVGFLDITTQATGNPAGGTHFAYHAIPHLTAVGLTTGDAYIAVGPLNEVSNLNGASNGTLVNVINLISPGSQDNLVLTEVAHFTITPDGNLVVAFDQVRGGCHG